MALDRLIRFVDSHSPDGRPLVLGVVGLTRGPMLQVRSLSYDTAAQCELESMETIPATVQAARDWLGY